MPSSCWTIWISLVLVSFQVDLIQSLLDEQNFSGRNAFLAESMSQALEQYRHHKAVQCCHLTSAEPCRSKCLEILHQNDTTENAFINLLSSSDSSADLQETVQKFKLNLLEQVEIFCGKPLVNMLMDRLWDCLLLSDYFESFDPEASDKNDQELSEESIIVSVESSPSLNSLKQFSQHHSHNQANTKIHSTNLWDKLPNTTFDFGINPSKLLCCEQAVSDHCRDMCYKYFTNDRLEGQLCGNAVTEVSLYRCLSDTKEVCTLGCQDKLHFCHYFNQNITESVPLFRNCNLRADREAEKLFNYWLATIFPVHLSGNNEQAGCEPNLNLWKILACTVHLRPCSSTLHTTEICQSNCNELLGQCLSKSKTPISLDTDLMCDYITTRIQMLPLDVPLFTTRPSCLDLNKFLPIHNDKNILNSIALTSVGLESYHQDCATYKCQKLNSNANCAHYGDCSWNRCDRHKCVSTCQLGKWSQFKVLAGNFVKIPFYSSSNWKKGSLPKPSRIEFNTCYNQCHCKGNGHLSDCYFHCFQQVNGTIWPSNRFDWNSTLERMYEVESTSYQCMGKCSHSLSDAVCDVESSQTYANRCIHRCLVNRERFTKLTRHKKPQQVFQNGNCRKLLGHRINNNDSVFKLICFALPKNDNRSKCVIDQSVQIFPLNSDILGTLNENMETELPFRVTYEKQHKLCSMQPNSQFEHLRNVPYCDRYGMEHSSLCSSNSEYTYQHKVASFSYFGQCMVHCSMLGPVCGRDLQQYKSECEAHAHNVLVDHFSSCESDILPKCARLSCPSPRYLHQLPYNQCPFCGSVAFFFYDTNYFSHVLNYADRINLKKILLKHGQINMQSLSRQLRQLVTVSNCTLYAHLLAPGIVVTSMEAKFSSDQHVYTQLNSVCEQELNRIKILIHNRSPIVQINFPLTVLQYKESIAKTLQSTLISNHLDHFSSNAESIQFQILFVVPLSLFCTHFLLVFANKNILI